MRGAMASQTDCVLDIKVIYPDAQSYINRSAQQLLKGGETEKIKKHGPACEARRANFVPFVVTTDGCIGEQAKKYMQRLGRRLADKWGKTYSEVAGFLNARVSIAIVRATSMCIRAQRDPIKGTQWCMEDGAALEIMLYE